MITVYVEKIGNREYAHTKDDDSYFPSRTIVLDENKPDYDMIFSVAQSFVLNELGKRSMTDNDDFLFSLCYIAWCGALNDAIENTWQEMGY